MRLTKFPTSRGIVVTVVVASVIGFATGTSSEATAPHQADTQINAELAAQPAAAATFPRPGKFNAITDVDGILVGQYNKLDNGYRTGTTVIFAPDGAENGVSVPGGWPGTINTDVLDPTKNPQPSNAIFLSGGSFYGLSAYGGVMQWLEEHGIGLKVGPGPNDVDPLVSGAIVYDLNRGGRFTARPDASFGYNAIANAKSGKIDQGNFGAGTATGSTPFKGGIGTASVEYANGLKVGAIIAVNAGTPVDPNTCGLLAAFLRLGDEFKGLRLPSEKECDALFPKPKVSREEPSPHPITAIAVVATNAKLSESATSQMASRGADGEVIAIDTIHTLGDGDAVFALSTGKWSGTCTDRACLETVYEGATKALARAVVHAILNAETEPGPNGRKSYCDALPSACKHLVNR